MELSKVVKLNKAVRLGKITVMRPGSLVRVSSYPPLSLPDALEATAEMLSSLNRKYPDLYLSGQHGETSANQAFGVNSLYVQRSAFGMFRDVKNPLYDFRYFELTQARFAVVTNYDEESANSPRLGSQVEFYYPTAPRLDPQGERYGGVYAHVGTVVDSSKKHLVLRTAFGPRRFLREKIQKLRETATKPEDGLVTDYEVLPSGTAVKITVRPLAETPDEKSEDFAEELDVSDEEIEDLVTPSRLRSMDTERLGEIAALVSEELVRRAKSILQ